jgi:hypothetical protein
MDKDELLDVEEMLRQIEENALSQVDWRVQYCSRKTANKFLLSSRKLLKNIRWKNIVKEK